VRDSKTPEKWLRDHGGMGKVQWWHVTGCFKEQQTGAEKKLRQNVHKRAGDLLSPMKGRSKSYEDRGWEQKLRGKEHCGIPPWKGGFWQSNPRESISVNGKQRPVPKRVTPYIKEKNRGTCACTHESEKALPCTTGITEKKIRGHWGNRQLRTSEKLARYRVVSWRDIAPLVEGQGGNINWAQYCTDGGKGKGMQGEGVLLAVTLYPI